MKEIVDPIRRRLRRLLLEPKRKRDRPPRWVSKCVLLLLLSRAVTYLSVVIYSAYPVWSNKIVNPFLFASQPMPMCWLIKYASEDVSWIMVSYAMCCISVKVSNLLFEVSAILLGWQIIDGAMFWINYKHSPSLYVELLWVIISMCYISFEWYTPERAAKIKSIF